MKGAMLDGTVVTRSTVSMMMMMIMMLMMRRDGENTQDTKRRHEIE